MIEKLEFDVYSWLARRVCNHVDSELLIDTELCWLTRQYEVKHLLYIEENSWQSITTWKLMPLKFSWVVMLKFVSGDIGGWQRLIKKLKLFCHVTGAWKFRICLQSANFVKTSLERQIILCDFGSLFHEIACSGPIRIATILGRHINNGIMKSIFLCVALICFPCIPAGALNIFL